MTTGSEGGMVKHPVLLLKIDVTDRKLSLLEASMLPVPQEERVHGPHAGKSVTPGTASAVNQPEIDRVNLPTYLRLRLKQVSSDWASLNTTPSKQSSKIQSGFTATALATEKPM